jgi:hypothetical protein
MGIEKSAEGPGSSAKTAENKEKGRAFGSRGAQAGSNTSAPNAISTKVPVVENIGTMQVDELQVLADKVIKSTNGELKETIMEKNEDEIVQLVKRIAEMYSQGRCIERTLVILCAACYFDISFENRVSRWRENFWKTKEVGFSEPEDIEYIKTKIAKFKERINKENGGII